MPEIPLRLHDRQHRGDRSEEPAGNVEMAIHSSLDKLSALIQETNPIEDGLKSAPTVSCIGERERVCRNALVFPIP
jgi:hypothetical protein